MLGLLRQVGAELKLRAGANERAIARAQEDLGWAFPNEYIGFLRVTNGATGMLASGDYIDLWAVEQILQQNRNYELLQSGWEIIAFGSNGGGEAFVFRRANGFIAMTPFIGISARDTVDVVPTFSQFLRRARPASWA